MTTGSGARDGGAGRAPGDSGGGGDRDDDPELRAMRAVWLTMRQEDPPDGGLSELLAAARAQGETMQARPTFWQRLVAGLRRPPALALATVMVLVCGAVILTRHAGPMEAKHTASRATDPEIGRGPGSPPATREAPAPVVLGGAPEPAGVGSRGTSAALDDSTRLRAAAAGSTEATATLGGGGLDPAWPRDEAASAPRAGDTAPEAAPAVEGGRGASAAHGAGAVAAGSGGAAPSHGASPAVSPEDIDSTRAGFATGRARAAAGSPPEPIAPRRGAAGSGKATAPARPAPARGPQPAERVVARGDAPRLPRGEPSGLQHGVFASEPDVKQTHRGGAPPEPAGSLARASGDDEPRGASSGGDALRFKADESKRHDAHADARPNEKPASPANATQRGSQADSLAQFYLQCESAARRGDCSAVKRIVGRITTTDRGYRARLSKDSPIAKCLAD